MTSPSTTTGASPATGAGEWLTARHFALVLGALLVVMWPEVVTGARTFCFRDFGYFAYPLAHYQREAFWQGELPLWNPLNNCGIPFLAQWNTLSLYPGSLIYLLLPLQWSLGLFCLLHQFLGGLGMYYLARRWTGSALGGGIAGMAYVSNSVMFNCLMWPNTIAALGLFPWIVLAMERGWRQGGGALAVAILLGGLQMLTGAAELIGLTWIFLAALAMGLAYRHPAERVNLAKRFILAALLVAALAAVQLLPFLELLRHSQRDLNYSDGAWALPASGWANFLVPWFHCYQFLQGVPMQKGQYWLSACHSGASVVLLVLLALRVRSGGRAWLAASFALGGVLLALGDNGFLYPLVKQVFPWIGAARYPVKFMLLAVFCVPLLAAFAAGAPERGEAVFHASGRKLWLVATLLIGVMAGLVWFEWLHPVDSQNPALWSGVLRSALLAAGCVGAAAGLIHWWPRVASARGRQGLQLALVAVVGLDAALQFPRGQITAPRELFVPRLPRQTPLPEPNQGRVFVSTAANLSFHKTSLPDAPRDFLLKRHGLFANVNLLDGIAKLDGFFPLVPREYDAVQNLLAQNSAARASPLLDFLGASSMTKEDDFFAWQPRGTAERIGSGGQRVVFAEPAEILARLAEPGFNPRDVVYLPPAARSLVPRTNGTAMIVRPASVSAHRLDFAVTAQDAGLVVLAQTWYPAWRATVDGQEVPVLRANHAFQAVAVPAGEHQVTFEYHDRAFRLGGCISLAALAACALLLFRPPRQQT